jgi:hypothetical protein
MLDSHFCKVKLDLKTMMDTSSSLGIFLSVVQSGGSTTSRLVPGLLNNADGSDVSFVVNGKMFPAHRVMLGQLRWRLLFPVQSPLPSPPLQPPGLLKLKPKPERHRFVEVLNTVPHPKQETSPVPP